MKLAVQMAVLIVLFPIGFPLLAIGFIAAIVVCAFASGWILGGRFLEWIQ